MTNVEVRKAIEEFLRLLEGTSPMDPTNEEALAVCLDRLALEERRRERRPLAVLSRLREPLGFPLAQPAMVRPRDGAAGFVGEQSASVRVHVVKRSKFRIANSWS